MKINAGQRERWFGAEAGDSVAVKLLDLEPMGLGRNAMVRAFGVLAEEFAEPTIVACPIRDGIISGTGVERTTKVRARIELNKDSPVDRPIIEHDDTVQIVGTGASAEAAIEGASRGAVDFVSRRTGLTRRDAYMLLGIVGDVRVGTSPRPIMAARVIIDKEVLRSAGWNGDVVSRAS